MSNKKGLLALSPLLVFILLYVSLSVIAGDFYQVPITIIFMIASIYAVIISGGLPLQKRVDIFSRGASSSNLLLICSIAPQHRNMETTANKHTPIKMGSS